MTTINPVGNGLSGTTGTGNFVGASSPTITTPKIAQINDSNGNAILSFVTTASAANYLQITNEAGGGNPNMIAVGSDTNIQGQLTGKGNGGFIIQGISSGSNSPSGYLGEVISSQVLASSAVSLSNNTAKDVTTISLTAGNWLITGNVVFQNSVASEQMIGWISSSSASLPDVSLRNQMVATAATAITAFGLSTNSVIARPTTTTTYYLSAYSSFVTGTSTACGQIIAVRI